MFASGVYVTAFVPEQCQFGMPLVFPEQKYCVGHTF